MPPPVRTRDNSCHRLDNPLPVGDCPHPARFNRKSPDFLDGISKNFPIQPT